MWKDQWHYAAVEKFLGNNEAALRQYRIVDVSANRLAWVLRSVGTALDREFGRNGGLSPCMN